MYKGAYSEQAAEVLGYTGKPTSCTDPQAIDDPPEDEPDLLIHSTMVLLARYLFRMHDLEAHALQRLKSQLHSLSVGDIFDGIKDMYASQNKGARDIIVTEAAGLYSQAPQLARALQKAPREIR